MRPELEARGVQVAAICADTPGLIKKGRGLHGLRGVLLSDPDLRVTDLYGLRNRWGLAPKKNPVGPLPIPTTILVDADGVVRWIDQADDYQVRSHPERVLAAIEANLPAPAASPAHA